MENVWPQLPVNEGVQSNCWKLVLILGYLLYFVSIIVNIANGLWGSVFSDIISIILFTMYQYHSLYYTIEVTEEMIEIKGGPCQWCQDWNDKNDKKRFLSASWCFSSQIYKTEIVSIETRNAKIWMDWFPRYYCMPIMWCFCHKSYNGWYFPFVCNNINIGGLCDGDIGPVTDLKYVQFNLTESPTQCLCPQRWTLNAGSGFSYNRISYVLRDPSVIDQLKQSGYQVIDAAIDSGTGAGGTNTAGGPPPPPVATDTNVNAGNDQTGATDTGAGGPPPPPVTTQDA